jgi:hypothetical protein
VKAKEAKEKRKRVKERTPSEIWLHIHSICHHRIPHCVQVALEVFDAKRVMDCFFGGHFVLPGGWEAILCTATQHVRTVISEGADWSSLDRDLVVSLDNSLDYDYERSEGADLVDVVEQLWR